MPTWNGWENQLLNAANLPTSAANRGFLDDWNAHAESNCGNNPIDISHKLSGSTNCHALPATQLSAQRYNSHAQAATAFSDQIHSGRYPSLLAALKASNPYGQANKLNVEIDLISWGAAKFNTFYGNKTSPPGGQPGGTAPHAHKGWHDLQHSVNVKLPAHLRNSQKVRENALRQLAQVRKVLR